VILEVNMGQKVGLLRRVLAVFTTLTVLMLLLPIGGSVALGSSVEPETVVGNPICGDFTDGGTQFKIENPADGTYTDGVLTVDLEIYMTSEGEEFDWSCNFGVDVVVAKGGPGANVYRYDPIVTGDTGLHAPFNAESGEWYELSYISFCYFPDGDTTTTTEALDTTTTMESSTTMVETTTTEVSTTEQTSTTIETEVLPTQVSTTIETEVLPTQLTTSTTLAEVVAAEELPFTGVPALRLWVLGIALVGAGVTALGIARVERM
jgi:hypothetical protein